MLTVKIKNLLLFHFLFSFLIIFINIHKKKFFVNVVVFFFFFLVFFYIHTVTDKKNTNLKNSNPIVNIYTRIKENLDEEEKK